MAERLQGESSPLALLLNSLRAMVAKLTINKSFSINDYGSSFFNELGSGSSTKQKACKDDIGENAFSVARAFVERGEDCTFSVDTNLDAYLANITDGGYSTEPSQVVPRRPVADIADMSSAGASGCKRAGSSAGL